MNDVSLCMENTGQIIRKIFCNFFKLGEYNYPFSLFINGLTQFFQQFKFSTVCCCIILLSKILCRMIADLLQLRNPDKIRPW